MENNLPKGWIECKLGDVCSKPQYGWTSKAGKSGNIKYLRTTDISDGSLNWDEVPFCIEEPADKEKYQVRKNDILVSRAGSVGLSFRIKEDVSFDAVFASYLIRFKSYDDATARLLEYFLQSKLYWDQISDFTAGIAIPNVNASKLEELSIPLPPLPEQQRIVEKLDALMARISNSKTRLEKIPTLLKNFRQSVLAAAVSGELTNSDYRIWNESILGNVILDKPKNGYSAKPVNYKTGYRILTLTATTSGVFKPDYFKYFDERIDKESQFWLRPNDILVQRGNTIEYVGVPAIYDGKPNEFIYPDLMMRLRADENNIVTKFLYFVLSSEESRNFLRERATGTAGNMPKINQPTLISLPIKYPSVEEQKEIVRKVEELFHIADSIEARYQKAKAWFDKLPQAILAKAFRGELEPQNENDEPASELLKRIQEEKHTISKQLKTTALKAKRRKSYTIDEDEELRMVAEG